MTSKSSPANSLSKEKLKNELIQNGISLPPAGSKKDAYVQLFEKHILPNQRNRPEFSSDEEDSKSPKISRRMRRNIYTAVASDKTEEMNDLTVDGLNIGQMSDDELRHRLTQLGASVGPIVDTTRTVYERQLVRFLRGEVDGEVTSRYEEDEYSASDDETDSRHSRTPSVQNNSARGPELRKRGGRSEKEIPSSSQNSHPDTSPFRRPDFIRETPTPRRSLRDLKYTSTDRVSYSSNSSHTKSHLNIGGDDDSVSRLASRVVEQIEEPFEPKRSKRFLLYVVVVLAIFTVFAILIYQNMESYSLDKIEQLPEEKEQIEMPSLGNSEDMFE